MRKWLAMLFGTAAIAVAGTALALTGPGSGGDEGADVPEKTETVVTTTSIEFDEVPVGMLEEDDLPDPKPVDRPPADVTPPEIVILHPEDGQVFETREVVFEGETEPGAKVFAGDHRAEVSDSGAWRLVLHLGKGENVVRVKAVDAAGNVGDDVVTVFYEAPEPKEEEPKKEEPRKEEPKKEEPKHEEPKEEPKEEEPKEEPHEWEFVAKQAYGECSENPPFDVFYGKGKPGTKIFIESTYGNGVAEVGEKGGWEVKVFFETAPLGEVFAVKVKDEFGNYKVFEFVHTD